MPENQTQQIDALLPAAMAVRAEEIGVKKAAANIGNMFTLAILAGAFIAFGAMLSTTAVTGSIPTLIPYGITRLIAGFVFSIGLVLVIIGGAELFTGNNLIVMAWANGKVSTFKLLRNWLIVYFGNFFGSVAIAAMVFFSGHLYFAEGKIGETALSIANTKTNLGFLEAVLLGILCNVLVCLAVWLSYSGRSTTDKILAVIPPVSAFVACGFEHSIANMYFITIGLLLKIGAPDSFWTKIGKNPADYPALNWQNFIANNLIPVTIGNIIGGAVLVGIVYWFIYLRGNSGPVGKT